MLYLVNLACAAFELFWFVILFHTQMLNCIPYFGINLQCFKLLWNRIRKVWRYHMSNEKPKITEGFTIYSPNEQQRSWETVNHRRIHNILAKRTTKILRNRKSQKDSQYTRQTNNKDPEKPKITEGFTIYSPNEQQRSWETENHRRIHNILAKRTTKILRNRKSQKDSQYTRQTNNKDSEKPKITEGFTIYSPNEQQRSWETENHRRIHNILAKRTTKILRNRKSQKDSQYTRQTNNKDPEKPKITEGFTIYSPNEQQRSWETENHRRIHNILAKRTTKILRNRKSQKDSQYTRQTNNKDPEKP